MPNAQGKSYPCFLPVNIKRSKQVKILINAQAGESRGTTVLPTKSDSDVIFCLQLLSKTLTRTLHLS